MEERAFRVPGFPVLLLVIVGAVGPFVLAKRLGQDQPGPLPGIIVVFSIVVPPLVFTGFLIVNPNQARVIQFFGQYLGAINRPGLQWTVPKSTKRDVSLRVRNFETAKLREGRQTCTGPPPPPLAARSSSHWHPEPWPA